MKWTCCMVCILYAFMLRLDAQTIRPLVAGDSLPRVRFNHIINAPYTSATLTNAKNKILLLDFFATWCGSCINALPRLDSLQKLLKDSLEIWVVMEQNASLAKDLLHTNPKLKGITLPFITSDTLLCKWFPHRLLPHEVWIRGGKVQAVTLPEAVTAEHIRAMLKGNAPVLAQKQDIMDFDRNRSLLDNNNGGTAADLLFRSTLTRELRGVGSMQGISKGASTARYYYVNRPLLNLFQAALGFASNRVVLDISDPRSCFDSLGEPLLFSYEITVPEHTPEATRKAWMVADLNRMTDLQGSMEKRNTICFVVTAASGGIRCTSTGAPSGVRKDASANSLVFTNLPLRRILEEINRSFNPIEKLPLVIDETQLSTNIDLTIPLAAMHDMKQLAHVMEPCGLILKEQTRELDMFVLRNK